jgi:phosphatidylglycerol:prolipoprotein diacylglycerol transferase
MHPDFIRIGTFEITSFGAMVALAAMVALMVFNREARRSGLPETTLNAAIGGVLGGMIGAKVFWAIEFAATAPFFSLLFSRGGLSWFGGFFGGLGTGVLLLRRQGVSLEQAVAAATPALAIGHAIGRIGCFLVGDDYGKPTSLPWGVAFPAGLPPTTVPVHPTQLYETALLIPATWLLLRWRRQGVPDRVVIARYLMLVGLIRFGIEFVRVNRPILGPMTLAQIFAALVMVAGAILGMSRRAGRGPTRRR